MTEKSKKYLSDIVMAIDLIEEFTSDITDFIRYDSDRKTQSAVERQLAIIGEALNQIRKTDSSIVIEQDKQIIN
jgi:uncharacterized protein with HEPN domain